MLLLWRTEPGIIKNINALPPSRFNSRNDEPKPLPPGDLNLPNRNERGPAWRARALAPDLQARKSAWRTAFCDGESGAQEKRRRTRAGGSHYQCAPAAHRAGRRAGSKSISFCFRAARVRITAPALRASARRCSKFQHDCAPRA